MALKKPSDYFKKESLSVDNSIQELETTPELNTFSDAFESFKNNLSKIEVLSKFSETLDDYQMNIERVNFLSEKVEGIGTEIQNLLKKEDLDRAMMSQLLVVEQSILDVQTKVKSINKKNLKEIRSDVAGLTESVSEFLAIEVPRYKKLVVDSELRTSKRYEELEENVSETLDEIQELVEDKYKKLQQNLQGINEQKLLEIIDNFKVLDQTILELKEQEIPKYKNLIVETERKTESKLIEFDEKLEETLDGFVVSFDEKVDQKIDNLHNSIEEVNKNFENLKEQEIPKYKNLIVETERKTESKLIEFDEKLNQTLTDVVQKINLVEGDKTDLVKIVNNKIQEIQNIKDNVVKDLKFGEDYKNEIDKKVIDLEIEIIRNESHIKVQNQNLEQIQENVRSVIDKLNLEEIEEQNYELGKKIKYLEEIFDKFNEKEFLSETIIVEPPSTNNKDSLTPLDKNFVTLEQLQQHYRLFINRIQQQLATIGGGGETRFEFLDDVDRDSVKQNGYIPRYDSSIGKFIGTSYDSNVVSSQWVTTTSGIHTLSAVGIGTTNPSSTLHVRGNALITGVTTSSGFNATTGNTYQINGTTVLSNNTLGSGVVNSSLTSVGTLNQLNVSGVVTSTTYNTGLIGSQTSGILTTTSTTTNQVLDNLPTATFQAARYQVSIACTGQLITAGMSPSVTSVGAITVGSGYTVATYTNVSLTGGSGNDTLANIGIGLSFNSVGFTSAIDLIVTTTEHGLPSGVGTIAVSFASSIPNTNFTGFAVTAGNIYYAVGVGTTTLRLFNNAAGTSQIIGIGTTVFSGVGNTMTKSGGVSSVQIVSPGSGYAVGNNLSATLGTIGSGFSFTVSRVVRNYQSTDVMIMHSVGSASTDCDYVEYASIANNEILGSFGADISGTNARLLFTPTYRNNTIKYIRTGITV